MQTQAMLQPAKDHRPPICRHQPGIAMNQNVPIIGFRQDRIGARMICILNILRLAKRYDTTARYFWLAQPDGPYPELRDPGDFLMPDFVARNIAVVDRAPAQAGRENLGMVAPAMNSRGFAAALAEGRRFYCDAMSGIVRFMDESPADVAAQVQAVAREMSLSRPLAQALHAARDIVRAAGGGKVGGGKAAGGKAGGAATAIHVRRGDILDGDPWSYSSWPSKYVPDEFFRAFMQTTQGPVIAFSDTPAAVTHLAQGDPRIVPVTQLFSDEALSVAERDLLELFLMSECAQVGAPSHSAFSGAASIIGGARVVALPSMLPHALVVAAYDALLDRVIKDQASFFAPGDLAQSVGYAARHAINCGRGRELAKAFDGQEAFLDRFPFLYGELAVAALSSGAAALARRLAKRGLKHAKLLRNRDRAPCEQVMLVTANAAAHGAADGAANGAAEKHDAAKEAPDIAAPHAATRAAPDGDLEAQFLKMCLTGREAHGSLFPVLARNLLEQGGPAAQGLMFEPGLARVLQQTPSDGGEVFLPLWTLRLDWSELIVHPDLQRELLSSPDMSRKLMPFGAALADLEADLAEGRNPLPEDEAALRRFGFAAAVLRLHGRLKRAFAILHWIDARQPGDALTHKRLADTCFTGSNARGGNRWLASALDLAPGNALLHLSAAMRSGVAGDVPVASGHLARAQDLWPDLGLADTVWRGLKKHGVNFPMPKPHAKSPPKPHAKTPSAPTSAP